MKIGLLILFGIFSFSSQAGRHVHTSECTPGYRVARPQSGEFIEVSSTDEATSFSAEVLSILKKHRRWQTITYSSQSAMGIPYFQVSEQKKWEVLLKNLEPVGLQEITSLSVQPLNEETLHWSSQSVDLAQPIDMAEFYFLGFQAGPTKTIRILDDNRFEIISSDNVYHVVFFPEVEASKTSKVIAPDIGVWTAPLGPAKQATRDILQLEKEDVAYLHHDLRATHTVNVDPSFPLSHLAALQESLNKWNQALEKEYFVLRNSNAVLNWSDCLSTKRLCIRWSGAEAIAWTGVGGSASFTFDPESGVIVGGIISFMNSSPEVALKDTPVSISDVFRQGEFGLDWIAKVYLQRDLFASMRHPMPELVVENILLHELGHFNGFSHNFAGSIAGNPQKISESIMDYFPFSAVRRNALGDFDIQNLRAIYSAQIPNDDYLFCSDNESFLGVAACSPFDLGNAADWFITSAEASTERAFAIFPGSGKSVLNHLGQFLIPAGRALESDRDKVTRYLCSAYPNQLNQIKETLFKEQAAELRCPL